MRISDWSSDVCSSDLAGRGRHGHGRRGEDHLSCPRRRRQGGDQRVLAGTLSRSGPPAGAPHPDRDAARRGPHPTRRPGGSKGSGMIIDAHAHIVMTDADYAKMATLTGARNNPPQAAKLPAAEVAEKTARGLLAKMDQVGTDVQFLSPRPYLQMHSLGPAGVPLHWEIGRAHV